MKKTPPPSRSPVQKTALLLSGGGARAAYQVGVLKAISEWYPRVHASPFTIYCGTSAGALNATSLACHSSCFRLGVKKLTWLWSNLATQDIFQSSVSGILSHLSRQGFARMQAKYHDAPPFGLLDNRPLRHLLKRVLNFNKIDHQILSGHLHGLAVTASNYQTSKSVTFFQGQSDIAPWTRSRALGIKSQITTEHLLASSAIPIVFPATQIGHGYYGDGSVHQIAPLRPALKLGAEKVLIIDLAPKQAPPTPSIIHAPGLATLGGHLMDAIFADTLSADLEHLDRMNMLVESLDKKAADKLALRQVDAFQLSPSSPFEPLVERYYCHMPIAVRSLMRILGISPIDDAAITSYLLFEPKYINHLIDMGYQDAQNLRSDLIGFLGIEN
ncbi:patatin-like phospholipase family protein [Enterovibrio sp. ZSDZ35]|uniref:Patatin-like phospholipase family protein n=1 Tax=Enterovibrio qingdaonensis TaxID=2899818 RepID=A0ABT5QRX2_9GAMM|nr:patatin-like phospholipase family protein [Enterovibrio sp. ZSDZ35]MDD1783741.1 patatin-like phospholipase family protein [Enterovibrio sp. ZSDZ35]